MILEVYMLVLMCSSLHQVLGSDLVLVAMADASVFDSSARIISIHSLMEYVEHQLKGSLGSI